MLIFYLFLSPFFLIFVSSLWLSVVKEEFFSVPLCLCGEMVFYA